MAYRNVVGGIVHVAHVGIVVAVVAHEHEGVLPVSGVLVRFVGDDFIDHHFRRRFGDDGETSDCHIG